VVLSLGGDGIVLDCRSAQLGTALLRGASKSPLESALAAACNMRTLSRPDKRSDQLFVAAQQLAPLRKKATARQDSAVSPASAARRDTRL